MANEDNNEMNRANINEDHDMDIDDELLNMRLPTPGPYESENEELEEYALGNDVEAANEESATENALTMYREKYETLVKELVIALAEKNHKREAKIQKELPGASWSQLHDQYLAGSSKKDRT
jgi:hypothetical protein